MRENAEVVDWKEKGDGWLRITGKIVGRERREPGKEWKVLARKWRDSWKQRSER